MPSLRRRLILTLFAAFVLIWGGATTVTWLNVRAEVEERFDEQLAQNAQVLWLLFAGPRAGDAPIRPASGDLYADRILRRFGVDHAFQIWNGAELLLRSPNAPETRMADGYGASTGRLDGERWRFWYRVDALRGIDVIVGNVEADRQALVGDVVLWAAWPVLLALPLLALLTLIGIGRALTPVRVLARRIGERSADDLARIPAAGVPKEIAPLTDALNGLFARLEQAIEGERRFTASASHELRTPLAALRAQAQVALRAGSDEERRRALQSVISGVDRATHLVEQLLTLARLDPDAHPEALEPIELAALAREVLGDLDAAARSRQIELVLDAEPAELTGQPTALGVLLRNLVDNAIRYAPAGTEVHVGIRRETEVVALAVSNAGAGIPAEERERVFDRFYRRLGTDADGSGLGLSIVRRVCDAHGASIRLVDAMATAGADDGPGLRIEIRFPIRPATLSASASAP